jgi:Tol biopolymer transport system component
LFTSNRDGKAEIYRITGANTERVTVSAGTSDDLGAYQSWAAVPIFGGFLFTSDRDGQPEIYRITGQSSEKLTADPPGRASWTAWSE